MKIGAHHAREIGKLTNMASNLLSRITHDRQIMGADRVSEA